MRVYVGISQTEWQEFKQANADQHNGKGDTDATNTQQGFSQCWGIGTDHAIEETAADILARK